MSVVEDVKTLKRVVIEGNGEPSLVKKVALLEQTVGEIRWVSRAILGGMIGFGFFIIKAWLNGKL